MAFVIRHSLPSDISAVQGLAALHPDHLFDGIEMWSKTRAETPHLSLAAELAGSLVGWAHARSDADTANKLRIDVVVQTMEGGEELESLLLAALEERALASGATQLRARLADSEHHQVQRLLAGGFAEHHRMVFSRVPVGDENRDRLDGAVAEAQKAGVAFESFPLSEPQALEFWSSLAETHTAVLAAMPPYYDDPPLTSTGESLRGFLTGGQYPELEGQLFVGTLGLRFAAYATVYREAELLHQGFTGVHPDFRRRGLALALKELVFDYARSVGVRFVATANRSDNPPILRLNSLGFRAEKEQIRFWKHLR